MEASKNPWERDDNLPTSSEKNDEICSDDINS